MYGVKPAELGQVTSKLIYSEYTKHTIPEPKVTDAFLQVNFAADVWRRFSYSALTAGLRQAVFDSVHGLVRNQAQCFYILDCLTFEPSEVFQNKKTKLVRQSDVYLGCINNMGDMGDLRVIFLKGGVARFSIF